MSTQTPRVIAFDDIREGDRIEVAWSVGDREEAYRGVAGYTSAHGAWCTEEGMPIVAQGDGGTITLLHRPTATEPKGLGAVVRARVSRSTIDPRRARTLVCVGGVWVDEQDFRQSWTWSNFDPESIEVLSEGIEVES